MSCNIIPTPNFAKGAKELAKRYKSLRNDLEEIQAELVNNPLLGTDLGEGLRKIRMAISSKGKGKSGGARIITYNILTKELDGDVYLIEIYDKSDASTVKLPVIKELLKDLNLI